MATQHYPGSPRPGWGEAVGRVKRRIFGKAARDRECRTPDVPMEKRMHRPKLPHPFTIPPPAKVPTEQLVEATLQCLGIVLALAANGDIPARHQAVVRKTPAAAGYGDEHLAAIAAGTMINVAAMRASR